MLEGKWETSPTETIPEDRWLLIFLEDPRRGGAGCPAVAVKRGGEVRLVGIMRMTGDLFEMKVPEILTWNHWTTVESPFVVRIPK